MYADDAVIFLRPVKEEVAVLKHLLHLFGEATGLRTNIHKSSVAPIRCENLDLDDVLHDFPAKRTSFPIKYLGLLLTYRHLRRVDFQPCLDKAVARLTGWAGRNITHAGRVTLTKAVLSSQPVFMLTSLNAPKKVLEDLDKFRKRFLWAGGEALTGGKCKVNWPTVNRPKDLGGLGVLDLEKFATALRLRWVWQEWMEPNKPWVGLGTPCNDKDKLLFAAVTTIKIGNGAKASFWHSAWIQGRRPKDIAPAIFNISKHKNRTVQEALTNNAWVRDINLAAQLSVTHLQ